MNNSYGFGRIILTLVFAMCLKIAPLQAQLAVYNPDWVLLTLIYWSLAVPERVGVFHAWSFGLLTDVLTGRMFGQYALAYSLVIYLCLSLDKRLRQFPFSQRIRRRAQWACGFHRWPTDRRIWDTCCLHGN